MDRDLEPTSDEATPTNEPQTSSSAPPQPETPSKDETVASSKQQGALTVDQALKQISTISTRINDSSTAEAVKLVISDHEAMKEKVAKLKSLLGRSAKAQREAKMDLDATQKRLDQALREVDRLTKKIDKLSNRPTHMDLLADFETNFDRALLSVKQQQTGEDTASPPPPPPTVDPEASIVEKMLMQELAESKKRIEKLESLNGALVHRSSQLESQAKQAEDERTALASKISHLELEKRMAVMEAEQATKQMHEKAVLLEEMQLEIDMVTKASVTANARAKHGEEMIKNVRSDKQYVQELESKVQALQEWALASSEAKTLAQERARQLEQQLRSMRSSGRPESPRTESSERVLLHQNGSFVVGAGDVGARVIKLSPEHIKSVKLSERVVLRWHFDLTSESADISFSIMRGDCDSPEKRKKADKIIKDRLVHGGAEGETEDAFTSQQACTIEWSNVNSWIRPKTVKFNVSVIVISDE